MIVLPEDTEIPAVPVNMGFDGSVKSRQKKINDPQRREETVKKVDYVWKGLYFASRTHT